MQVIQGSSRWGFVLGVALSVALAGCGEDNVDGTPAPQRFAVLSTFPAEMAPLLAQMTIDHTEIVNGRMFRIGTLAGVPVVLGVTGIGLLNAANTTRELLDRFEVAGVILSAVAGGTDQQIGDVAVLKAFALKDGTTYAADQQWLAQVSTLAASGKVDLERCTVVANPPPTDPVCLPQQPAVRVGGIGLSSDPYGDTPFACMPGGADLYGCDLPAGAETTGLPGERATLKTVTTADATMPVTMDMETAAIARETQAHGLPFIGFRAISDGGTGDPLGSRGFLQFAIYYRFAARNAAALTVAFLKQLAAAQ